MPYLVVLVLSLGVAVLTYVVTIRNAAEEPITAGFEPLEPLEPSEPEDLTGEPHGAAEGGGPRPGYTYLEVMVTRGPTWRERIQGLVGTIVLVVVGIAGVAFSIYLLGSAIQRTIDRFLGS
jgi:hypothetical protein